MAVTEVVRPKAPGRLRAGSALLGPAFVASIAYVDPGNVASNISAGARYGYLLVWVIVAANLMAVLVQYLSAKLGLVTGMSLPDALRARMPRGARLAYWGQAGAVAMATDLAEVVGGAIALNLLFDLPLIAGGLVTGVVSLILLLVQDRRGQRTFERVITGLLMIIAIGFLASLFVAPPSLPQTLGGLVPRFDGAGSILIAAAMLGAVAQALGPGIALLFAIGLLASGLASTSVGAYAGAMIMQGLLHKRIPLLVRRLVTLTPALLVLALGTDPSAALIVSQVVLSFGIPFALVPLIRLTADRTLMGADVNRRRTTIAASTVAAVIIALNLVLIYLTVVSG